MNSLDCLVLDCYFSHSFWGFSLAFKLFCNKINVFFVNASCESK